MREQDIGIVDLLMPPFDTLQGAWQVSYGHGWFRGCSRSWRPYGLTDISEDAPWLKLEI